MLGEWCDESEQRQQRGCDTAAERFVECKANHDCLPFDQLIQHNAAPSYEDDCGAQTNDSHIRIQSMQGSRLYIPWTCMLAANITKPMIEMAIS